MVHLVNIPINFSEVEALIFVVFPLFVYLCLKVAIWRDRDYTAEDLARFYEGIKLMDLGFTTDALSYFEKAVNNHPKSMVAYAMRAKCHYLLKNYYQAIYNYDKAQSLSHDLPEIFLYKGICLFEIKDYELALKEFNKAVWFYHDTCPVAYRWRAKLFNVQNKSELSQKDLEKAVTLENKAEIYRKKTNSIVHVNTHSRRH